MSEGQIPEGWYHAEGDPPGTSRWWDGRQWVGEPQVTNPAAAAGAAGDTAAQDPGPGPTGGGTISYEQGTASPGGASYPPPGAAGFPPPAADPAAAYPPMGGGGPYASSTTPGLVEPWPRIGGRVVDGIIWMVIWFVVSIPFLAATIGDVFESIEEGGDGTEVEPGLGVVLLSTVVVTAAIVAYEVFLNINGRSTPGKSIVSARIVKEDGSPLDTEAAVRRMIPFIGYQGLAFLLAAAGISGLEFFVFLILAIAGVVMLFTDSRRQTPWDKTGKTIVVRK